MKSFKKHWCVRPISYMLSLHLVVLPLVLMFLGGGVSAQAQGITDLTRTALPQWAVLDFSNDSGYGGSEIGRQASDSLVLEIGKTNKIDVVPRQQVLSAIQTLGLSVPLDAVATQKLGRELNVDAVVVGNIATVAFDNNPRRATAGVIVKVVDSNTGLYINGAIAQGTSTPRPIGTNDDDALVNQAIDNGTFAAVKQITNYSLPKATVMQAEDENTVLLNKGTKDGLYDGLDLVVTRRGSEVGRVRVSRAGSDNSDAVVTVRGAGIAPEDKATAIFQLPHYSVSKSKIISGGAIVADNAASGKSTHRSNFSGVGGILASVLIGALLLSLVKRGNGDAALGGGEIGAPTAVEIGFFDPTGAFVVGGQGPSLVNTASFPLLPGVVALQDYSPVAIHVTANHGNVNPFLFQEFHCYRPDFTGQNVTIVGSTVNVIPHPGQLPVYTQASPSAMDFWDDGFDRPISYQTIQPGTPAPTLVTSLGGIVIGTGLHTNVVGKRFAYTIEGLWKSSTTGGSSSGGLPPPGDPNGYALTKKSATNTVTYLQPVLLQTSSFAGTEPASVKLTLKSTLGANDYILQLSGNAAFSGALVYKPFNPGLIQPTSATQLVPRGGAEFPFFDPIIGLDMTQVVSKLGNPSIVFARVGVRDSANGASTARNPYIFSQTVEVDQKLLGNLKSNHR